MSIVLFGRLVAGSGEKCWGRTGFVQAMEQARAAREAGIDALLLSDRQSAGPDGPAAFEAGTLAAALAVATDGIGLVPSISTEHLAPYHVARLLATIDQFSAGWSGWEIGAPGTAADSANYHARDLAPAASQRARADEFAGVLAGLWDSFEDDAFLRDRDSGIYFRPERLRSLDHRGEYFDVAGPLNIARPPQGHPVQVRRVTSGADIASAGRFADVVLLPSELSGATADLDWALMDACRAAGRTRQDVRLLVEQRAGIPVDRLLRAAETGPADGFVLVAAADAAQAIVLEFAHAVRQRIPQAPGDTLRARLGLPRPAGRSAAA
ncbi:LLM class flavin-dependent oxidoreductase [Nocardia sp. NEAU-G5]|uniref:LLM class flavin-dependent oxidoreductase n=1 Tax=Nocardia albiluteola TaxID=2842303 RepID=A0ABS6BCT7_9NOCA|nr:LLM class flavin-dependent oxidoreductase [Nocardia albiluteola]MBU3068103.1 LLM class flavin-dependent oxidoreductase [Nocardia albiluteola]